MKWYEIAGHHNRCVAYGNLDGDMVTDIQAKVWRLDDGSWAYACNTSACINRYCFAGSEPNRKYAIKAVMENLKKEFL